MFYHVLGGKGLWFLIKLWPLLTSTDMCFSNAMGHCSFFFCFHCWSSSCKIWLTRSVRHFLTVWLFLPANPSGLLAVSDALLSQWHRTIVDMRSLASSSALQASQKHLLASLSVMSPGSWKQILSSVGFLDGEMSPFSETLTGHVLYNPFLSLSETPLYFTLLMKLTHGPCFILPNIVHSKKECSWILLVLEFWSWNKNFPLSKYLVIAVTMLIFKTMIFFSIFNNSFSNFEVKHWLFLCLLTILTSLR